MSIKLPQAVAGYLAAKNTHDVRGMLSWFVADAHVRDEGRTHDGTDAIGAWMEETTRKYRVQVKPLDVTSAGGTVTLLAEVSGTFPGSPARLQYHFGLTGDRIARLEVGA